ncbi:MAG TPA: VTT domain-containing protein [Candidatus Flavonifractor merdipullorum]|uniref:TVP38/TMEM64 family membrane protein n=1 Tax=Candidatus Flavonifractor merdipullorum TaxID=2838590 RepID=A0A9D1RV62_9FIRM|nr:VTT domain-containing protein [Candidatus Flavonifractor merdipullorum]
MKKHAWGLTLALTVLLLGGGLFFLWYTGFFDALGSMESIRSYIERFTPYTHLVYFLVQLASVVIAPIPSNITALAGGVLFGTWLSFFLTALAVVSGSMLVFFLARGLGRSFVDKFVSRKISEKYLDVIRRKRDIFLILVFLFPFFPDDLICALAGLTDIPAPRFLVLVICTRLWGLLVASAIGGSAISIPLWGMVLIGIAGVTLFLVGLRYGDRWEEALLNRFRK